MDNLRFLLVTTLSLFLVSCATTAAAHDGPVTPTPTPTPTPEPCSEEAIKELVHDAQQLVQRYREATTGGRGLLPLLPDVQELRRDVDQLLELPGCAARVEDTLNRYIDVDLGELARVIGNTKAETIDEAIESAQRWFEEHVGTLEE